MRMKIGVIAVMAVVAGCSKTSDPVGENSAGSIRTTAVGTIVGAEPSPTPAIAAKTLQDANMSAADDNPAN